MERRESVSTAVESVKPLEAVPPRRQAGEWHAVYRLARAQQAKALQMAIKRTIDLVLAGAALVVSAVPMAIIALAIRLESRGPILFTQERIGHNGKRFRMLKFRSMVINAEALRSGLWSQNETDGPLFKIRHDPRRTRVGQVIRRFSLDELPQLFNVVQGHMSLVGPRPVVPDEASQYSAYHAQRFLAVPGMTGLWQVSGRSLLGFDEMVELDIRYATDWSLWLDLQIFLRTIPVIISGKGAY